MKTTKHPTIKLNRNELEIAIKRHIRDTLFVDIEDIGKTRFVTRRTRGDATKIVGVRVHHA